MLWERASKAYRQSLPPLRTDRRDCKRVFRAGSSWIVLTDSTLWAVDDSLAWRRLAPIHSPLIAARLHGQDIVLALRDGTSWGIESHSPDGTTSRMAPPSPLAGTLPSGFLVLAPDTILSWTPSEAWFWSPKTGGQRRFVSSADVSNGQINDILRDTHNNFWLLSSNRAWRLGHGDSGWIATRLSDGATNVFATSLVQGDSGQLFASGLGTSNSGYLWIDSVWQATSYLHAIRASDSANRSWTANGSRIVATTWTPGGGRYSSTSINYDLFEQGAVGALLGVGFVAGSPANGGMVAGVNEPQSLAGSLHLFQGDSIHGSLHVPEIPLRIVPFEGGYAGAIAEGILMVDSALSIASYAKLGQNGLPQARIDRCERHPRSGLVCHQFASGAIGLWDAGAWSTMLAGGTTTIVSTPSGILRYRDSSGSWHTCAEGDCSNATLTENDIFPWMDSARMPSSWRSSYDATGLRDVASSGSSVVALWKQPGSTRLFVFASAKDAYAELDIGVPASMVRSLGSDSTGRIWFFTEKGAVSWMPVEPLPLQKTETRNASRPLAGPRLVHRGGRDWLLCDGTCTDGMPTRLFTPQGRLVWQGRVARGWTLLPRAPFLRHIVRTDFH